MTNPGTELVLLGNPRGNKVAKKSSKRAKHSKRKGKMPEGLRRYLEAKRAGKSHSAAPTVSVKTKSGRRKGRPSSTTIVTVSKNPKRRRRHGRNPGTLAAFSQGITGILDNAKATFASKKASVKSYGAAAGGAIGSVVVGAIVSRITGPILDKINPTLAANPIVSRVLSFVNFYGAGFLLARFLPVGPEVKRSILTGATMASVVEAVRPGTVKRMVAAVPGIGPIIAGKLEDIETELSDYVASTMEGLGFDDANAAAARVVDADVRDDDAELSDYLLNGVGGNYVADTDMLPGVGGYVASEGVGDVALEGMSDYELGGFRDDAALADPSDDGRRDNLGCDPASQQLVTVGDDD